MVRHSMILTSSLGWLRTKKYLNMLFYWRIQVGKYSFIHKKDTHSIPYCNFITFNAKLLHKTLRTFRSWVNSPFFFKRHTAIFELAADLFTPISHSCSKFLEFESKVCSWDFKKSVHIFLANFLITNFLPDWVGTWISSYLSDSQKWVVISENLSSFDSVSAGIPQRNILVLIILIWTLTTNFLLLLSVSTDTLTIVLSRLTSNKKAISQ